MRIEKLFGFQANWKKLKTKQKNPFSLYLQEIGVTSKLSLVENFFFQSQKKAFVVIIKGFSRRFINQQSKQPTNNYQSHFY